MVEIAHVDALLTGDVGGAGISRYWFQRVDAATITGSDCNAAAAAVRALYGAASTYLAADMTYTFPGPIDVVDHATGLVQNIVPLSSVPTAVTGGGGGNYAAGTGFRLNWKTLSVHNRRFIRGANFLTPVAAGGWTTGGVVAPGAISGMASAITTYLAALNTAGLEAIIWHRPAKGTFTGGAVGLVVTGAVSPTPAGLRTRRTLYCGAWYSAEFIPVYSRLA
jgi:hypothetical protein